MYILDGLRVSKLTEIFQVTLLSCEYAGFNAIFHVFEGRCV